MSNQIKSDRLQQLHEVVMKRALATRTESAIRHAELEKLTKEHKPAADLLDECIRFSTEVGTLEWVLTQIIMLIGR